jgi:hypothetical protein
MNDIHVSLSTLLVRTFVEWTSNKEEKKKTSQQLLRVLFCVARTCWHDDLIADNTDMNMSKGGFNTYCDVSEVMQWMVMEMYVHKMRVDQNESLGPQCRVAGRRC